MALVSLATLAVQAQVRTDGLPMPQALQGLPPAGSQCARTATEASQAQRAAALPPPDTRCLLSVSELARDKAPLEWTWVDVRRSDLAESDAMPGALRLSSEQLRSKGYLKAKRVLLLGNGQGQAALLSQCRRLKDEGFTQVRVLNGGWPQWRFLQAQTTPGSRLDSPEPLSASALWAESQFEGNLVVGQRADGLVQQLPFGAKIDSWSVDQMRALIERRRKESAGAPLVSVVLVYAPERSAEVPLQALRQALLPTPLMVYVGKAEALRTQLAQMEATWLARERGPKQPRCGQ